MSIEITLAHLLQALYQESQIRTRNVVERCFGVWKRRFPVLSEGMRVGLKKSRSIISAAAVLHNIALIAKDEIPPVDLDTIIDLGVIDCGSLNREGNCSMRTRLIQEYFSKL